VASKIEVKVWSFAFFLYNVVVIHTMLGVSRLSRVELRLPRVELRLPRVELRLPRVELQLPRVELLTSEI